MRSTNYYGNEYGAIEIELRKGSVKKIVLGTVKRYTVEEQAMGAGTLKFSPFREITGPALKQALRIGLSQARAIYQSQGAEAGMAAYDRVISSAA